jgi:hypothetical protein
VRQGVRDFPEARDYLRGRGIKGVVQVNGDAPVTKAGSSAAALPAQFSVSELVIDRFSARSG